jgi:hypothetical protein
MSVMLRRHSVLLNVFPNTVVSTGNYLPPFRTVDSYVWFGLNTIVCFVYSEGQKMRLMNGVVGDL